MTTRILTSHKIAEMILVDPTTVNRWIDSGRLKGHRTLGGHRRVREDELVRFLRSSGIPVPDELGRGAQTVLIIDDDPKFRRSTERTLRKHYPGLDIVTAEHGIDGLLRVGLCQPDAIILDMFMPGLVGTEVCKRLRAIGITARVIGVSGEASAELRAEFMASGGDIFLSKPVRTRDLIAALALDRAHSAPSIGGRVGTK